MRNRNTTGLDYADQRYYSPSMGRFLSPDPSNNNIVLTDPGTWNAYVYANGDPTNNNDPTGLNVFTAIWNWIRDGFSGEGSNEGVDTTLEFAPRQFKPRCDPKWFDPSEKYKSNDGHVFTGADLNYAARVVFAEASGSAAAAAGGYTAYLEAEREGVASVLYNRIGNPEFGSPKTFTKVANAKDQFQAVTGPYKDQRKFRSSNQISAKNLSQANCDDLKAAIDAVDTIITNGPTLTEDSFWSSSTGHSGYIIGGTVFFNAQP